MAQLLEKLGYVSDDKMTLFDTSKPGNSNKGHEGKDRIEIGGEALQWRTVPEHCSPIESSAVHA